jgi:cholesterol 24(S)-hydroxylase
MVDDFLTLFVGGQETTANTLSFCLMELGRNPDVLIKLREELDSNIASKSVLEYEDIIRLSYTGCTFKETLRLWPPIPEIGRHCTKTFEINGYEIPVDSMLQVSTYVSGRYDKFFEQPQKFEPDRFSYKNKDK